LTPRPLRINNEHYVHFSADGGLVVQVLKDDVRRRIEEAALRAFAGRGFVAATMGEIAAGAGVSTGNLYRYCPGKEELFDAVIPPAFVYRFRTLLRRRVRALSGRRDVRELRRDDPYHLASEDLLRLCIDHRLRVIVLLARAGGSRWDGFDERTAQDLVRLAIAHFSALDPELVLTRSQRFDLVEIYRSFVRVLARILERFESEPEIREAVAAYTRYHLAGLKSFFEGEEP
jgi:AcrR family transcriptional regulator